MKARSNIQTRHKPSSLHSLLPVNIWSWAFLACFTLPLPALAQVLHCGDVVEGSITSLGQRKTYALAADAGDVVRLTSVSKSGGVGPDIDVINSSGVRVAGFGYNDGVSTWAVAETDTYAVRVSDRYNDNTGTFVLGVVFGTPKCDAIPLHCGIVLTNTITSPAEQHTYSLDAVAGEVVRITTGLKSGVIADVDIFSPAGTRIAGFGGNDGVTTWTVPATGDYTIVVRDRGNDSVGMYTLGVVYATPKCPAPTLACGQTVTGTTFDPIEQKLLTLNGVAGEEIRLISTQVSGGMGPDLDVFNPSGVRVTSFGYKDFVSTYKLTSAGTFIVLVRDRGNDNAGTFKVRLDVIGGCSRFVLGSSIVRTQDVACLPLHFSVDTPAKAVGFTVQGPAGHFLAPVLQTGTRFAEATVTAEGDALWRLRLRTPGPAPPVGDEMVGSLCFNVVSTDSAFVPLAVTDLVVTNIDGSLPSVAVTSSRVVVIADKPLLEATLNAGGQRVLTVYGKADSSYVISSCSSAATPLLWTPTLTNLISTSLFYSQTLPDPLSSEPALLLKASED